MISIWDGCCKCDTHSQPCLSNPINKKNVLKYIHKKYHKYLLSNIDIYGVDMLKCNSGKANCIFKHSYPYIGNDEYTKDDHEYVGEYDDIIYRTPLFSLTLNDKKNIILEPDIPISNIELSIHIMSRKEILLFVKKITSRELVPFSINPQDLHELAVYHCH